MLEEYLNSEYLIFEKSKYQIMVEDSKDMDHLVKMATRSGNVTLAMREFGRGTDFICSDSRVENNGGIVVI